MAIGSPYTIVLAGEDVTTATTSYGPALTGSSAAGDCIVAFCANSNSVPTGCSDTKGNVYTAAITESVSGFKIYGYVAAYGSGGSGTNTAALVAGTDIITFTFTSTGVTNTSLLLGARGCSGILNTSSAVDAACTLAAGVTVAGTTPAVTGGSTLAQASEWIIAGLMGGAASLAPSGWSNSFVSAGSVEATSGADWLTVADEIVSATTAQNASCTIVSAKWAMVQLALKAASSGTNAPAGLAQSLTAAPSAPTGQVTLNMTIQGV